MKAKISSAIRSAKSEVRRSLAAYRGAMSTLQAHEIIVTHLAGMVLYFLETAQCKSREFWVSAYGDSEVVLTFYVNGLQSFKDPAIVKACAFLDGAFEGCRTEDYAASHNRDIVFRGGMGPLRVKLALYADSESASCKRIEVGRELREQIQYKLVCED